ncbi:ABC transporter substrate-binding protein [Stanieria cyanosphaera]|uniref:ABC transporter substrate-binding protein n=1 Tax=Stanieria cyanosphaera TaxID=102116 RepID=UPI0014949896|nr:ABC transporter substrate-binding protein [Stanieria cyanosphaera]
MTFSSLLSRILDLFNDRSVIKAKLICQFDKNSELEKSISYGEKNLNIDLSESDKNVTFTEHKETGNQLFLSGEYNKAFNEFKKALIVKRNAPETSIYYYNSLINNDIIKNQNSFTVAVIVPGKYKQIDSKSMLQGFAQAQQELYEAGGINGKYLKIAIFIDNDKREKAQQIACYIAEDSNILAVTGHWTSDVSLAAVPIYNANKILYISPISTTIKLSGYGDYIYRTNITNKSGSANLANYMKTKLQKTKVAIFYVKGVSYSEEIRSEFKKALGVNIFNKTYKIAEFDYQHLFEDVESKADEVAQEFIAKAKNKGAEVILLATDNARAEVARQIIQANAANNNEKLEIIGDLANLYQSSTLDLKKDAEGLVLAVSWHNNIDRCEKSDCDSNGANQNCSDFPNKAVCLWGGDVNFKAAMCYDAMKVIIEAIKKIEAENKEIDRQQIAKELKNNFLKNNFSAKGALGEITFSSNGDRKLKPYLVKVEYKGNEAQHESGYDFVPIESSSSVN